MTSPIYLDHNATTPVAEDVAEAMRHALQEPYGNPSSTHWAGYPARDAIENARSQVAAFLSCDATEVVFTSGGTEANNQAIKGLFFTEMFRGRSFHAITSVIEHPAVLEPLRFLERLGAKVTYLPVDQYGLVDSNDVRRAIRPDTRLISIMHANNEVGTIQPINEIASLAHEQGVLVHTDAAQSVGKIPVDVESLGVDLLSVAGHKFYGPKGVGALFVREGVTLTPLLHGAGHEGGKRAGTENITQIVGLGAACAAAGVYSDHDNILHLRNRLWHELKTTFADEVVLNGHPDLRLPNTLNMGFRGKSGSAILARMPDVAASTGSACHAGHTQLSPVLVAMGVSPDIAAGAIRFSLGRSTTSAEIESVVGQLAEALRA